MAGGTIGDSRDLHVVLLHELSSHHKLILRRLIFHVEHFFFGAYELFRVTMAIQTPTHEQCVLLPRQWHQIDPAMARFAPDALRHMNAVVEVNEIRQVVDTDPLQRFLGSITLPNRFQHGTGVPNLGVARHARMGWRDPGKR